MKRGERKYVVMLAVLVTGLVVLELAAPRPVDWTLSFQRDDSRPYGGRILYTLLPHLFPGGPRQPVDAPPFTVLRDTLFRGVTYLFLTDTFAPDAAEAERLLAFVARGNTVFVGAHRFEGPFADSLRLRTAARPAVPAIPGLTDEDSVAVNLVHPALAAPEGFYVPEALARYHFTRFDTARTTLLGEDGRGAANLIRMTAGMGRLVLTSSPLLYTNYALRRPDRAEYAYRVLGRLPDGPLWWDAHYKPIRREAATPLRFVLSDPALRWAYYLALGGLLLFLVFGGRRRQRVIPVIAPPKNETAAFVRTVGHLYARQADPATLAERMMRYFLEDLRTRYHVALPPGAPGFAARLVERTGIDPALAEALARDLTAGTASPPEEKALLHLGQRMADFYEQSRR